MPKFILFLLFVVATNLAVATTHPVTTINTNPTTAPDWSLKKCPPLAITSRIPVSRDGVRIEDISFQGCHGNNVSALLVGPLIRKPGKQPAIVYVHWYEPNAVNSNRTEFLDEAKRMARKGVVSLLVSTFWSVPGGDYQQRRWQDDYDNTINQTQDLLRAIAIVRSLPEVDKKRIAYVGHDYGAAFGAIVSGIDTKVKAFALIAGCPKITDWYLYGSHSGTPDDHERLKFVGSFKRIQPVTMLAKAKSRVLLQYGSDDKYISLKDAEEMHKVAPQNSRFVIYDAEHAMALPLIARDRREWLEKVLTLSQK